MKNIFKINILTYIFLILSMLSGYGREMFIIYFILVIHEIGHYILFRYYNIGVNKITLYPYGGIIDNDMLINTNSKKVLLISLGGILMQLILYLVVYLIYSLGFINYSFYDMFNKYNLYIILFNLIPIYPLDGFKILNSLLELILSFKFSLKISVIFNFIFIILFFLYLYIYKINNYIIVIFLLCSLINYIKSIKYIINKFYLERFIYDIKYDGIVSVNSKDGMFKNKYNYINGVGEKFVIFNNV